jgi:hypothetical protein
MSERLQRDELVALIRRVFAPTDDDRSLGVMVDLPDAALPDRPGWAERRRIAEGWVRELSGAREELELERLSLIGYRNVRANNADLPERAHVVEGPLPADAEGLPGHGTSFADLLDAHRLLLAPTELSATAPLKLLARHHGFRAATMPGFSAAMIPALRLDYEEIDRRCQALKQRLDAAEGARLVLEADGRRHELQVDLRQRWATASSGVLREPGTAGNLPSGETYIVPYEGERPGQPSRTAGSLPVELDGELLVYRIEENRAREVVGDGDVAVRERAAIADEPAYANIAEIGLGVLGDYGLEPIGTILLDEKLGLHVAFGRSDHFGGSVGAQHFSAPDKVVHIDRVYVPALQPRVTVREVTLDLPGGRTEPLMRDGRYV